MKLIKLGSATALSWSSQVVSRKESLTLSGIVSSEPHGGLLLARSL